MSDIHMSLRLTCPADIFRNIDLRFAEDMALVIANLSETGKAKLRDMHDRCDEVGMGRFIMAEMNHYRANRGN